MKHHVIIIDYCEAGVAVNNDSPKIMSPPVTICLKIMTALENNDWP